MDDRVSRDARLRWAEAAQAYITLASHTKGMSNAVSAFMKHYGVGESEFGRLMDLAGSHVPNHRLYGHHVIFDLPRDLIDIPDFLLHELSDLFTNYGLPILPGHVLEGSRLYNHCMSISTGKPWNMVNGFDLFAGTLAIYQGLCTFNQALRGELLVEELESAAKTFGIGALELALALSTSNPFLFVGCLLQVCAGLRALLNEGSSLELLRATDHLCLEVQLQWCTAERITQLLSAEARTLPLTAELWTAKLLPNVKT